uniref:WAPL domain-containing protein n=1 Tax=Angiostrongylus cantonensis TaxID=6313 RepID=A0A0K0DAG2_ANGCA
MCVDDSCLLLLCGFIHDLVSMGSIKVRLARHRKLINADATSALIRTLRCRLKEAISRKKGRTTKYEEEDTTLIEQCDDTVAALVLAVGAKARNAQLALRHRGFAKQLLVRISSLETKDPVESALLARCLEMLYFVAKTS